jgi:hypothetical protein
MATLPKKKKKKESLSNKLTQERFTIVCAVLFFAFLAWVLYVIIW